MTRPSKNPTLLVVDSATNSATTGSIALTHQHRTWSYKLGKNLSASEHLLPLLDEVLRLAKCTPDEIDVIACGVGPGAFTGLRMACGIVQGLAFGWNKPVIAVSHLAAMADLNSRDSQSPHKQATLTLAVLDARMQQVYWSLYDFDPQGALREIIPATVSDAETMWAQLDGVLHTRTAPVREICVIGDVHLTPCTPERQATAPYVIVPDMHLNAFDLLSQAGAAWDAGQLLSPEQLAPLYVRNDVAKTLEERGLIMPSLML